jgi:hypothetical protein
MFSEGGGATTQQDVFGPTQPVNLTGAAFVQCSLANALVMKLMAKGIRPAVMGWTRGASTLAFWETYPAHYAWCAARFAELTNAKRPIVIYYAGQSGTGSAESWKVAFANIMAQHRAYLGPNAAAIVVQLAKQEPWQGTFIPDIIQSQGEYPRTDVRSRIVQLPFVYPPPNESFGGDGSHLNAPAQEKLAGLLVTQVQSILSWYRRAA